MNLLLVFLSTLIISFLPGSSIYDLQMQSLDGTVVNLSAFKGKKILVAEFDAIHPDTTFLKSLNSMAASDSNLAVIAVPATDFNSNSSTGTGKTLQDLKARLALNYLIAQPALVKKGAKVSQQPLFSWLTHAVSNIHFNEEVNSEGQLYVISEKGILYAVIGKGTSPGIITNLLNQTYNE